MSVFYGDPIWEKLFSSRSWGKYPSEEAIRFFMYVKKRLGKESPRALDIGCGRGAISWFMAKNGAEVSSIDGAPSALKDVNSIFREFNVDSTPETVLGDITNPAKFLSGKFDIMIDHYSICHNHREKVINAFSEYSGLMDKGGFIMTCGFGSKTTDFGNGMHIAGDSFTNSPNGENGTITFFTRDELDSVLEKSGFSIEYHENILMDRNGAIIEKMITAGRKI
ncbi:MAG: hypothetical protein A2017_14270 [Lentisphaerae bacterium GWF2_44_16]|nr:MAG: hypothetical protein A2017_14270 [Lentisphaerae bacterium GWF2_44_16]